MALDVSLAERHLCALVVGAQLFIMEKEGGGGGICYLSGCGQDEIPQLFPLSLQGSFSLETALISPFKVI